MCPVLYCACAHIVYALDTSNAGAGARATVVKRITKHLITQLQHVGSGECRDLTHGTNLKLGAGALMEAQSFLGT